MNDIFPEEIRTRLAGALEKLTDIELPAGFAPQVTATTDPKFGDYQSNAAMVLAKQLRTNPRELAAAIIEGLELSGFCETPEIAGPGFINFRLETSIVEERLRTLLTSDTLGVPKAKNPRTIVIDFSAPNIAKPMHVGHIRSTFIGDCLVRTARFLGHNVIADNHIGDWGKQFGMILYGWKNHLEESDFEKDPIGALISLYRKVNALAKEDPAVNEACRSELVKLQVGDSENLEIWKKTIALSRTGLKKIYAPLDIHFDEWLGESAYNDRLSGLTDELIDKKIASESDGAICVFFPDNPSLADKGPCIVRKNDGGFGYAATDIATIEYRLRKLRANEAWYVVGAPQQLHFDQIFSVARTLGLDIDLHFVSFGSILGDDRKMLRTREGDTPQLADLIDEAIERARAIVEEKNPTLPAEEKENIARTVGIGSLKYAELSQNRMTDYIFNWEKMLAFQGNTAPYLQNAYVRIRAIFRKLGETPAFTETATFTDPAERALALNLLQFGEALPETLSDHRPNLLANYIYELATTFHGFYEACPVLPSEGKTRETRLLLCEITSRVLRQGLELLGIRVLERM